MFKAALGWALAVGALAGVALAAAPASPWQDGLDVPAAKSPLAARALINGLAQAAERLVAVGQRGHVLLSDDQGKSWRQAEVPSSSDLVAVAFATPTQGWAVGHDGIVLRSADAGASWTRVLDGRQAGALMPSDSGRPANRKATQAATSSAPYRPVSRKNGRNGYASRIGVSLTR